jgi:glycosyltransferase involved in cell wall biosynthesis
MGPLISVVIPTYNHAKFLERALQSVLDLPELGGSSY